MFGEKTLKQYKKFVKETEKFSKSMPEKERAYFYNLLEILKYESEYYMSYGLRSNGKSTAIDAIAFIDYIEYGHQLGLIRRWDTDFKGKNGRQMFDNLNNLQDGNFIKNYSHGRWERIVYKSSQWFLSKYDESLDKDILDNTPFCTAFALNVAEHDKSTSYTMIKTVFFDEFISRKGYIDGEFIEFTNVLSTIIRYRRDVMIFMAGNSVNKYCPHFNEMGLYNIKKQQPDTIDFYRYGEEGARVVVEFTGIGEKGKTKAKPSDIYFTFNNPKLKMITTGAWEIGLYPHLPTKYKLKNIKFTYFVIFDRETLQCEIIKFNKSWFTYVHRKTTPIQNYNKDLVYTTEYSHLPMTTRKLNKPRNQKEKMLWWFYKNEKVFFQDNEVGEIMRNYLLWCDQDEGVKSL